MKTTRNPPSSSSQSSEAELAFCGDIILTPLFFFSLFLFSFLPSLPCLFSPIHLYSAKDTSNDDDDDRQTQTDRQTNKQTHHAALRDMVHAQNGRTLFRFFFYIFSTASLVKIGGGSVSLNLSLSLFSSLSFLQGREVRKWRRRQARRIRSLSLSCVCVCVFVRLRIWRSLLSVRFWEWRREEGERRRVFVFFAQTDMSEPKRTKE